MYLCAFFVSFSDVRRGPLQNTRPVKLHELQRSLQKRAGGGGGGRRLLSKPKLNDDAV